jgi:hypothetical protein
MRLSIREAVVLLVMMLFAGPLFGGCYWLPLLKLTSGRDPWLTIGLICGLAITVFGLGYARATPRGHMLAVWLCAVALLLALRAAFGNLGRDLVFFGMAHMVALLGTAVVSAVGHAMRIRHAGL